MQPLQDDHRQRRTVLPTPAKALRSGQRQRRSSDVPHVVHHMPADTRIGRRGQGARALPSVPAQGTRGGRVRCVQQVQVVCVVAVRRLQRRPGTVSRLRRDVRRVRFTATPHDHRPPETVPLFQVQGEKQRPSRDATYDDRVIFRQFPSRNDPFEFNFLKKFLNLGDSHRSFHVRQSGRCFEHEAVVYVITRVRMFTTLKTLKYACKCSQ